MRRTFVALAVVAIVIAAALARADAAQAAKDFTCTHPVGTTFTCEYGGHEYTCTVATPAAGSFTCVGPGNKSFVCTRAGANAADCTFQPSGKTYACQLVAVSLTSQEFECVKKKE